jgi:hypothetical protein
MYLLPSVFFTFAVKRGEMEKREGKQGGRQRQGDGGACAVERKRERAREEKSNNEGVDGNPVKSLNDRERERREEERRGEERGEGERECNVRAMSAHFRPLLLSVFLSFCFRKMGGYVHR